MAPLQSQATSEAIHVTASEPEEPVVPPFHPLADARAGEWARYASADGSEIEYRILDVDGDKIKIQVSVYAEGTLLGMPAVREEPRTLDPLERQAHRVQAQRSASPQIITVANRAWEATCYQDRWTDEEVTYARSTWVSNSAPVFGTLRMEHVGDGRTEAGLELISFGWDKPKPGVSPAAR